MDCRNDITILRCKNASILLALAKIVLSELFLNHRQPKRTMCEFGLQRSFGRNILELLVHYLMPNKCKNLKDMKSSYLSVCISSL